MKFSNSVEYAIHGLIYIGKAGPSNPVLITDIAQSIAVPEAYLRKIFQQLAKSGIVTSLRGAHGGFTLSRLPNEISLKDIVESIEGSLPLYTCLKAQRHCNLENDCPVKKCFDEARDSMAKVLQATTLKTILSTLSSGAKTTDWLKVFA
jgi:Rrf2 family protein